MKRIYLLLSLWIAIAPVCYSADSYIGTVHRDTLLGVPCMVYVPMLYQDRTQDTFPCLYLQHGMFGSENDWTQKAFLVHHMDSLLLAGAVAEMVVIMPDNFLGSMPPDERAALMAKPDIDPDGVPIDTKHGSAHWQKLTRDQEQGYEMSGYWEEHFLMFKQEVERHYRVSPLPQHTAIAGLSMGGFHTMHVSHFLNGQFRYIGLFSPVILPRTGLDLEDDVPTVEDSPYQTSGFDLQIEYESPAYSQWMLDMRQMLQNPPLYWIGIGRDDFLYAQLQDYRHWLETNNFEYTYYESTGGHTWRNWQDYLCRFLPKLFKQ